MSLDEWRWYTMLAYRTGGGPFVPREEGEEPQPARGSGGDRELMRRLLVKQLEAARDEEAGDADWIALLEAEVARLEEAREWPWSQGLPARVRDSLAERAEDLQLAHCAAAEDVEMEEVQQDGVTVRVQ